MKTLIQNGTLVLPDGERTDNLWLEDGTIAAIGGSGPTDCTVLDAAGCLVFPGFIDPHTHLEMDNGVTVTADDFASGTAAALAGGTTCLIDFATQTRGGTLTEALALWHSRAAGRSSCDYGFHMAITDWNAQTASELPQMLREGVSSFKLYMAYDNLRVSDAAIYETLRAVGALGGLVGVHCENGELINELTAGLRAGGQLSPRAHPLAHPAAIEAEAAERLFTIAELADTPVLMVHLSTARGLEAVRRARERGVKVYAESCPQYFLLDDSRYRLPDFEGAKYVCSPPLRQKADQAALWRALEQGEIDTLATDHCSFNQQGQKELGRYDFSLIPNGLPGIEHRPAAMFTAAVGSGRLSPTRLMRLMSEQPAKLYGLFPQRGTIAVGSQADLVVWDPAAEWTITADRQLQRVDYTPYEGMPLRGRAKAVLLHGVLAAENGRVTQAGLGRYAARKTPQFYR